MSYIALHNLRSDAGFGSFDPEEFSLFKHGSGTSARRFGAEFAQFLIQTAPVALEEEVVIIASCYKYAPVAAQALADEVAASLDECRRDRDLPALRRGRIYRGQLFERDYSALSEHERIALLSEDALQIDEETVSGKHVLVIDDIRITGGHERKIDALLAPKGAASVTYAYLAAFERSPESADIESKLNLAGINSVAEVFHLAHQPDFRLNSRAIKYLLSSSTADELAANLPSEVLIELYRGAIGNGYGLMPRFNGILSGLRARLAETLAADGKMGIANGNVFSLYPLDGEEFPAQTYSEYKYGSGKAAQRLGLALGRMLWENDAVVSQPVPITLTTPAYGNTPIGAAALASWAAFYVNDQRFALGYEPVTVSKVTKHSISQGNYAELSYATRQKLLQAEEISVVEEHFRGKHAVIIDDAWITGASAAASIALLERAGAVSCSYAVIVSAGTAAADPTVESRINHASIDSPEKVVRLHADKTGTINQRVCKYLLDPKNGEKLKDALRNASANLAQRISEACVQDGLNRYPSYKPSFDLIAAFAKTGHRS